MIAFGDELLADHIDRAVAADGAAFVEDLLDEAAVCQHDCIGWTQFQAEDAAIFS